ncbi:hypothetical protein BDV19DRAFT_25631 [Aspergillus venezuelensis]
MLEISGFTFGFSLFIYPGPDTGQGHQHDPPPQQEFLVQLLSRPGESGEMDPAACHGESKAASGECDWITANWSWLLSGASRVQSAEKDRGKHQRNTERRTLNQSDALQLATPTRPLQVYSSIVPECLRFRVAWGSEHFRCARRKFGPPHQKVTCEVGKHGAVSPAFSPGISHKFWIGSWDQKEWPQA